MNLILAAGALRENCFVCDTNGLIYEGRTENMNKFKEEVANPTKDVATSLEEVCHGADVLIGLSTGNRFTEANLKGMNKDPIVFALAIPTPEILPEVVKKCRPDCIVATGRPDFPNQINNVLCFPYLFRAVLDTSSS